MLMSIACKAAALEQVAGRTLLTTKERTSLALRPSHCAKCGSRLRHHQRCPLLSASTGRESASDEAPEIIAAPHPPPDQSTSSGAPSPTSGFARRTWLIVGAVARRASPWPPPSTVAGWTHHQRVALMFLSALLRPVDRLPVCGGNDGHPPPAKPPAAKPAVPIRADALPVGALGRLRSGPPRRSEWAWGAPRLGSPQLSIALPSLAAFAAPETAGASRKQGIKQSFPSVLQEFKLTFLPLADTPLPYAGGPCSYFSLFEWRWVCSLGSPSLPSLFRLL